MRFIRTVGSVSLLFLFVFALPTWAIDVDTIIQKHIEAIGGKDLISKIQAIRIEGKGSFQGIEAPMTVYQKRPNKVRLEMSIQGMTFVQASNGIEAWWINPFLGKNEPALMPEEQGKNFRENADFISPFLYVKERGYTVKFEGEDDLEGTPVYKVSIKRNDIVEYHYFDKETFLDLKQEVTQKMMDKEVTVENVFGDFNTYDGLVIPTSIETRMNGQTTMFFIVQKVEINPEIDDSIFNMP